MTNHVGARLRNKLDDDIREAIKGLGSEAKSEIIRTGIRLALGIGTQQVFEVRYMPVKPIKKIFNKTLEGDLIGIQK